MSIFPFLGTEEFESKIVEMPVYKEVAWDFVRNKPLVQNKEFVFVEGNEAIKVWIFKSLKTNRFEYEIYSWDFGSEIENLIGSGYSKGFIESEANRFIKEALLINPYIISVHDVSTTFKGDLLTIYVNVGTIYGEVIVNVQ